ncbi:helix-turn-helix domain-containing protein [Arthrobacter bambusae]|uniref:helix-turn-helix domain-containing protein n=1 Tax=Arthrobacter bambusae TaxID=1338426 RepID=UPI00278917D4|nr:helix-turn-helix transcriptional regulator [Arthrobacter bambusae]MDQ0212483.1 transcriptional regulator with XRE-family HTH domain [Arthrobacter bambusae]MDQ0236931.1 transcriptional regulator with XRE-family HTH domain [Arthrobacter bambusae]
MHVLPARDAMERIGDTIGGASDLTQVELAARLQVSQNRVSRIEHGDITASRSGAPAQHVRCLLALPAVLGPEDLHGSGDGNVPDPPEAAFLPA